MPKVFDANYAPRASNASAIGNPYLFTGRRFDPETGFYWYRTRYLDPRIGRFTSRDTIGIWGDLLNVGNGLAYVGNNPWTWVDPYGLITKEKYWEYIRRVVKSERICKDEFTALTQDQLRAIVARALQEVSGDDDFVRALSAAENATSYVQRLIDLVSDAGPLTTAVEINNKWEDLGGKGVELLSEVDDIMSDRKMFLKRIKTIQKFISAGKLVNDLARANELGTAESVEVFADILDLGSELGSISKHYGGGITAMLSFYAAGVAGAIDAIGGIEDTRTRQNVEAIESCSCPTNYGVPFELKK